MTACQQSSGQTILQHGEAVAQKYRDLMEGNTTGWKLPDWFIKHGAELFKLTPIADVMEQYHIYHDCAKGDCLRIDEDGKRHFSNHAMMSAALWLSHGGDSLIGKLIEHDMDMHLLKPADVDAYKHLSLVPALLLTALSEIHANAEMFGGIDSTSFKIKFKQLSKTGQLLCDRILGHGASTDHQAGATHE